MRRVRITVLRKCEHRDLMERYENPMRDACPLCESDVFISEGALLPDGFCQSAWHDLYPYVLALANGCEGFFDGWMKDPGTAVISCNDGIRPVSFLLEAVSEVC